MQPYPLVTTAPVPCMSSLKQRYLSCILSRMANALSVAKSSNWMRQPGHLSCQSTAWVVIV